VKILHVTPAFYPATYWGGPIYSVYGLCNALASLEGVTLRVLTTDSAGPRRSDSLAVAEFPMHYSAGYDVYFCKRWFVASVSPGMLFRLWSMIRWADVVHLTGTYSAPTLPTLLICRLLGKPLVWSPRGALQRWGQTTKPWLKRVWEWFCNLLLSQGRCMVHVTSEQEENDSKKRITHAGFAIVRNGVDIPPLGPDRTWRPEGRLRLLYLGRLHPIKGIEQLLHAMKMLDDQAVILDLYGNGSDAYRHHLQRLVRELALEQVVRFHGHVDGDGKAAAFANADVCVVPSYSENFGMVVAESLAHGVPVIASRGTPWAGLENHDCGLWVDNEPESLANAIRRFNSDDLRAAGSRGRVWMIENFSWELQAGKMYNLYKELADRTPVM